MPRPPSDPATKKKLFNCYMDPEAFVRLKLFCARRSVLEKKRLSEGGFIEECIGTTNMPRKPTAEEIEAYFVANPKHAKNREELERILALPPPKL